MSRIKGPRKINRYPDEFKVRAVRMSALPSVRVQDVAHALDSHKKYNGRALCLTNLLAPVKHATLTPTWIYS